MPVDTTEVRRSFLTRLAARLSAIGVVAGGAAAVPAVARAATVEDAMDQWFGSMKGTYKAIYDCAGAPSAADGVLFASNLIRFSAAGLGTKESDNSVVVCFRHFATPFGYNDAMWAKYPRMAQMIQVNDPKTNAPATRNWLLSDLVLGMPETNIPGITAKGVQFAICGAATAFIAGALAGTAGDAKAIEADLAANLIPKARMAPAGVVAIQRAQKAGFAYTFAG